jgi:peptide/nickel transport system permease protein
MKWRRFFQRRIAIVATAALLVVSLCAIAAPVVTKSLPDDMDVLNRLQRSNVDHRLGTDHLGRDVWTLLIYGARTSLLVGLATTILSTFMGTAIGAVAGYYPKVDGIVMRVMDGLMALPDILLAIALMSAFGPSTRNVILALTITYTPRAARLMRSAVIVTSELEFVEAAKAVGASDSRIIVKHILPNAISPMIVQGTFTFANAILAEASLSFLGAGVPPIVPTWGTMLSEGRGFLRQAPWLTTTPGLAVMLVVSSLNIVGDALRDTLDPKLKNL